jgi:CRISPR/Cas system-associated protein Cas7 (RAMP superfamily)
LAKTKSDASTSTTLEKIDEQTATTSGTVTTTADIETNEGFSNDGYEKGDEDDDSDVSTTIIDGKRAISLHNFGKFAAQQQQREAKEQTFRSRNSAVTMQRYAFQCN